MSPTISAPAHRAIDVGCSQINLRWHPDAFDTVTNSFDPEINRKYAAEFLKRLRGGAPSWRVAVGD